MSKALDAGRSSGTTHLLLHLGKLEHKVVASLTGVLGREETFHVARVTIRAGSHDAGRGGQAVRDSDCVFNWSESG